MFRTATTAANEFTSQFVSAQELGILRMYQSNHLYLGLALEPLRHRQRYLVTTTPPTLHTTESPTAPSSSALF